MKHDCPGRSVARRLDITGSSEAEEPGLYDRVTNLLERTKAAMEKMGGR